MAVEKDVKLGSVGDLDIALVKGKAVVTVTAEYEALDGGVSLKSANSASVDAKVLLQKLFAAIEKASPPGVVPLEEGLKTALLAGVDAVS